MASKEKQQQLIYWHEDTPKIPHINFSRVQLRRVFSRGSMELGGRFYGGWWQQIPSAYRPRITIDGKPTTEIDFSAMSLRILYAYLGAAAPCLK